MRRGDVRRRSGRSDLDETPSPTPAVQQHAETGGVNVGRDAGDIHTGPEIHFPLPRSGVLIALGVLIVIAVTMAGLPAQLFGYLTTKEASDAEQVRACMAQHQMTSAHAKDDLTTPGDTYLGEEVYSRTTFRFCDWPRRDYSAVDGYSEIRVVVTPGPGDYEATDATALDRIVTTCPAISVVYQYGSQAHTDFVGPYTLRPGDVVSAFTGEAWEPQAPAEGEEALVVYPYPQGTEVVVVRNSKIVLDTATCELSDASPRPFAPEG